MRAITKRRLVAGGVVLLVLLAVIGGIAIMKAIASGGEADPYTQGDSTSHDVSTDESTDDSEPDTNEVPDVSQEATVDLESVTYIAVGPMGLDVPYMKTIDGFEFYVFRTPAGTQYVEFRNPELVGTKCTDDSGTFASIIEDPASNEAATLTKTVDLAGTRYGLSLASDTCTSNVQLLNEYQAAFSDAFPLLRKLSS